MKLGIGMMATPGGAQGIGTPHGWDGWGSQYCRQLIRRKLCVSHCIANQSASHGEPSH